MASLESKYYLMTISKTLAEIANYSHKYGRTFALLGAIIAGMLIPQAAVLADLIQYIVFAMMFLSFVGLRFERSAFRVSLVSVLAANIGMGLATYFVLRRVDHTLAMAGFMAGISPTAISSPVVMGLLNRRVDYTVSAVLVTNVSIALLIPFLLPAVAGNEVHVTVWAMLWSVIKIAILPLILARLVLYLPLGVQKPIQRSKGLTFFLWISTLFIVVAKASQFIRQNTAIPLSVLAQIGLVAFSLCVINFGLGALISGPEFRRETSQVLGQKNLTFAIWLALTYVNPIVALGPTFYIIFHNAYNSFQLYQFNRQKHGIAP